MKFIKCNCVRLIDDGVAVHAKNWSDGFELLECGVVENFDLFFKDRSIFNL